jgi:hypothetical protein
MQEAKGEIEKRFQSEESATVAVCRRVRLQVEPFKKRRAGESGCPCAGRFPGMAGVQGVGGRRQGLLCVGGVQAHRGWAAGAEEACHLA